MASPDNRVVTIKEIEDHHHTILNIQMEEAGREGFLYWDYELFAMQMFVVVGKM